LGHLGYPLISNDLALLLFIEQVDGTIPGYWLSFEYEILPLFFGFLIHLPALKTERLLVGQRHDHTAPLPLLILLTLLFHHLVKQTNFRDLLRD
jgi:hypothetical protein